MRSKKVPVLAFATLVSAAMMLPPLACAGPMLSLTSPDDLANLVPGQSASFEVVLSGLSVGDELEFLFASVVLDDVVFETPTITPGPIIPETGDFEAVALPGLADGIYDSVFGAVGSLLPIASNGTFFSFDVTVAGPGTGEVTLDFVDSFGFDSTFSLLPPAEIDPAAASLSFRVMGESTVPEPASLALWGLSVIAMVGLRRLVATPRRRPGPG